MVSANEHDPPELSITIPEKRDLLSVFKKWGDLELPIDIILLNRAAVGWAVSCSAFGLFFFFFLSVTISKPPWPRG